VRLTAAITHQGDCYVARCLEVEVASQGETFEAARSNLVEALELFFEDDAAIEVCRATDYRLARRGGVSPSRPVSGREVLGALARVGSKRSACAAATSR
jgi:predicted RNase H-like HicB family nuclease